jgi:hypothetical protein
MSQKRAAFLVVLILLCATAGYLAVRFPLAPAESIHVQCARQCHPLASRVRVTKINPFVSAESWRNILGKPECVCGSS